MGYHKRALRKKFNASEFNGPSKISHGHMRSGRGCCELMNLDSPLQALVIDPGLFKNQGRCTTRTTLTKYSGRVGRARRFGGGSIEASSLISPSFIGKRNWIQWPMSKPAWNFIWFLCCGEYVWAMVAEDGVPGHGRRARTQRELNGIDHSSGLPSLRVSTLKAL